MTEASTLNTLLATAQAVTDATGKSVLLTDANGVLGKISEASMRRVSLNGAEEAGTVLPLKDFIQKYIQGKQPGQLLTDTDYNNSTRWSVTLKGSSVISLQNFCVMVTKVKGNVNSAWCGISFIAFSTVIKGMIYFVSYCTENTADIVNVIVSKIDATVV